MDANNLPSRLPQHIIELCTTNINKYKAQYKEYLNKRNRMDKLRDNIPRSIRFQAKLNVSDQLKAQQKDEFTSLQQQFDQAIKDCTATLHGYIQQAAALEIELLRKEADQIQDDFKSELLAICISLFDMNKQGNAPTTRNQFIMDANTSSKDYAHTIYTIAIAKFQLQQTQAKQMVEADFAIQQYLKDKKAQHTTAAMDLESDLPQATLVGNLIDQKISKRLSSLQGKMNKMEHHLKGKAGRPGKVMNSKQPSPNGGKVVVSGRGGKQKPKPRKPDNAQPGKHKGKAPKAQMAKRR